MHGLAAVLERRVVVVNVGGKEYFGIPCKALARGEVGDLRKGSHGQHEIAAVIVHDSNTISGESRGLPASCGASGPG